MVNEEEEQTRGFLFFFQVWIIIPGLALTLL